MHIIRTGFFFFFFLSMIFFLLFSVFIERKEYSPGWYTRHRLHPSYSGSVIDNRKETVFVCAFFFYHFSLRRLTLSTFAELPNAFFVSLSFYSLLCFATLIFIYSILQCVLFSFVRLSWLLDAIYCYILQNIFLCPSQALYISSERAQTQWVYHKHDCYFNWHRCRCSTSIRWMCSCILYLLSYSSLDICARERPRETRTDMRTKKRDRIPGSIVS